MFSNIGTMELLIILFVALIVFGPGKIPQLGKALGQSIREFKQAAEGIREDMSRIVEEAGKEQAPTQAASQTTNE
ncbi:MAG: twin-arginine translocase TatA/TatE family subunit [Acidobacteriota bacterium]